MTLVPAILAVRESGDAVGQRPGDEAVPAVVDPAVLDPSCPEGWCPLAVAELLDVDVPAARGGEEDRGVDPRRHRLERLVDLLAERDEPLALPGLRAVLQLATAVAAPYGDQAPLEV